MKLGMDTDYLKRVFLYFCAAVLTVFLMFYLCYHLFNGFASEITTEMALETSAQDTLTLEGYLFRDETVVHSSFGGTVDYAVADGERVGIGAVLARVYAASDDGSIRRRTEEIDEQIKLLEESNISEGVVISDTTATDARIDSLLYALRDDLEVGRLDYARHGLDGLLVQLNKREIITGAVQNYNDRIAALEAEKDTLTARLSGSAQQITGTHSGYFFYGVDGYESLFDTDALGTMTLDDFAALKHAEPRQSSAGAVGKLVEGYTWYVAVPTERALLDRFDEGGLYRLTFPYNYNTALEMTLSRIVTEHEREDAVLIFSCTTMPEGFSYLRVQNVEITMRAQSGLLVPEEAVRIVDGVTGVYVLHGGKVEFRRIVILLQRDGDCIVDAALKAEKDETPFLAAHEHIITAGKSLYDGKVLN
ncbi:MAG: hypothetical protein IJZ02_03365 [Clostridia bacterium]|nr:hypothetical protein [Clostridia bacterium]